MNKHIFKFSIIILAINLFLTSFAGVAFAQYKTTTQPVQTTVGNPSTNSNNSSETAKGDNSIANAAIDIANAIIKSCGGTVNSGNYDCLANKIPSSVPHPELAYNEIVHSAISYTDLQCVGFVQSSLYGATGANFPTTYAYAFQYAQNGEAGYQVIGTDGTIMPGDIIVWKSHAGDYPGHIAVITKVYDANTFQIAEANFDLAGGVRFNNINRYVPNLAGWLRKQ